MFCEYFTIYLTKPNPDILYKTEKKKVPFDNFGTYNLRKQRRSKIRLTNFDEWYFAKNLDFQQNEMYSYV